MFKDIFEEQNKIRRNLLYSIKNKDISVEKKVNQILMHLESYMYSSHKQQFVRAVKDILKGAASEGRSDGVERCFERVERAAESIN